MSTAAVPQHIIDTINTILAPYGETFVPGAGGVMPAPSKGYMRYSQAAKYTNLSVPTLRRAVAAGILKAPRQPMGCGKNGACVFAVEDLDAFLLGR